MFFVFCFQDLVTNWYLSPSFIYNCYSGYIVYMLIHYYLIPKQKFHHCLFFSYCNSFSFNMYYLGFILSTKDTALVGQLSIIAMHDQIIMITITLALLLTDYRNTSTNLRDSEVLSGFFPKTLEWAIYFTWRGDLTKSM